MYDRRTIMWTTGAVIAAGAARRAEAGQPSSQPSSKSANNRYGDLRSAVSDCVEAGDACHAHCLEQLSQGNKSLADCARAIAEMRLICQVMGPLAALDSALLPAQAKICRVSCERCANACEPHAGHHSECKACRDACVALIAELKRHFA